MLIESQINIFRLRGIRERQNSPWAKDVGYLIFITDDRNPLYFRMYVGQTARSKRCLIKEHGHAFRIGKRTTLLYWICSRDNGERCANFIRLWEMSRNIPKGQWRDVITNVLEMVFCEAFESLPSASQKLFYSTSRPSNRGFGLNVMPPLLQVLRLNPAQKTVWNIPVSNSTDPEIRLWLEVKDKESKGGDWYELLTREDYAKAVVRAGPEDIAAKWVASTQSIVVPSDRETFDSSMLRVCSLMSHENLESVRPTGSFSAKIGFVSGYLSIEEARSETQGLAWGVTTMQSSGHGV
jgi:hypothetical protein